MHPTAGKLTYIIYEGGNNIEFHNYSLIKTEIRQNRYRQKNLYRHTLYQHQHKHKHQYQHQDGDTNTNINTSTNTVTAVPTPTR